MFSPISSLSYVPVVSAVIAAISATMSVGLTMKLARKARGNKLLPIMVFYRGAELKWILKNVREALNVSILNYSGEQLKDELELYPIAPGQQIKLDYLKVEARCQLREHLWTRSALHCLCEE